MSKSHWEHQHLDWVPALTMLDRAPFLLALRGAVPVGCLACPPDRPEVAWLRVLAIRSGEPLVKLWRDLWAAAERSLTAARVPRTATLPSSEWLQPLLEEAGFHRDGEVVFLEWRGRPPEPAGSTVPIRSMQRADLPPVTAVDHRAFRPPWRLSAESLQAALNQAICASVSIVQDRIVGYQISTAAVGGAHLARLAVDPEYQGRGIGRALVGEALRSLSAHGHGRVTVNTQGENRPSLRLYDRCGFLRTGVVYPVYQKDLPQG